MLKTISLKELNTLIYQHALCMLCIILIKDFCIIYIIYIFIFILQMLFLWRILKEYTAAENSAL